MATRAYTGSCHCGAVKFRFTSEEIVKGCRCNCSICRRKGAVMSDRYVPAEDFKLDLPGELGLYQWGDRDVNHYFCKSCGIHPFAHVPATPSRYRVNLGCVDGVDTFALELRLIDGASF